QLAKIETLTDALEEAFGRRPRAFRAGRYGIGPDTVAALVACGYRVDSSVSPFVNLEEVDDGPTFVGAPFKRYRLAPYRDVREPDPDGPVLEMPLSYGFNRGPFPVWDRVQRVLEAAPLRWLRLPGPPSRGAAPGTDPQGDRDPCSRTSAATGSCRWSRWSRCISSRRSPFTSWATTGTERGISSTPSRAIWDCWCSECRWRRSAISPST